MKTMLFYTFGTLLFLCLFFGKKREFQKNHDKIVLGEMIGSLVVSIAGVLILISSLLG